MKIQLKSFLQNKIVIFISLSHISLSIGSNDKPLAAIGKFFNVIGKLMIGKTFATNREKTTNATIGNDTLTFYW